MAYDDSEALQPNSTYSLGGYTFELKVQNVHEPGEPDVVSVFAICRSPDGTRETVPMDFPDGTTVESWTVEANETEASVYVTIRKKKGGTSSDLDTSPITQPLAVGGSLDYEGKWNGIDYYERVSGSNISAWRINDLPVGTYLAAYAWVAASASPGATVHIDKKGSSAPGTSIDALLSSSFTYQGKTVYYYYSNVQYMQETATLSGPFSGGYGYANAAYIAWTVVYGYSTEFDEEDVLVARFAIDLREADGGPDGDWDEPGDTGDPSYTLNVHVTGASSGSNSGIPLEAQEQTTYGSGGIGGNGGGGGAGASTVIIYEFATDKAGTVNQEATAQGPGTGGPGGKGGKGGDGCILIFY